MRSPLFTAFIYLMLGVVFTYFAIEQVKMNGWNFFVYVLLLLATLDFGAVIRLLILYFKLKNGPNSNKKK